MAPFNQGRVTSFKHAFVEVRSCRIETNGWLCSDNGYLLKRVWSFLEPVSQVYPKAVKASSVFGVELYIHILLNKEGAELLVGVLELQAAEDDDTFFDRALS